MYSINEILRNEVFNIVNMYKINKCYDINFVIKDVLSITKPIIINYIKLIIKNNIKIDYYQNSVEYSIQQDILQLRSDGCLFSDMDIQDIYVEHTQDFINIIYHYIDLI